ncbi:MAG: alpha-galactosidase [Terriglobales bacterium]
MTIPKQTYIDRREFLHCAAGGLLLSVLATKTSWGATGESAKFASDNFSLELEVQHGSVAAIHSLRNPETNFEWVRARSPLAPVLMEAGQSIGEWKVQHSDRQSAASGNRFEFVSQSDASAIRCTTALQAFSDAPIVEFQTEFQNSGKSPANAVTAFGPFRFALRDDIGPLRVHAIRRDVYGIETKPVSGEIAFSGGRWNAPEYCGLLLLEAEGKDEFLLVGIEWERGWRYRIEKNAAGTWISVDLTDLTHNMAAGEKLSAPRVFLGLAHGDREQAFLTARHYMQRHVFPPFLQNWPWVVYDFWATDAEGVQDALLHEVDFAAKLGVDIFVHDASWYSGSSKKGTGDWGCGLGNYTDDRQKFPMGLAAISRKVHDAGMKFGLWVGPNIVDSRLIGTTFPKLWTAQLEGKDLTLQPEGWENSCTQVCLGCREYIDFLKDKLTHIVREFDLNWLKWDNSGIPKLPAGCDRADHGHQRGDGSYAALVGQYEIFDHLHRTFPDLVLEQCGYGSRLDYGLARTIRANWLSDSSYPSEHVRQNALMANYLYPSCDNGAWIVSEDKALVESASEPALLDTVFRSRMLSLFGFGTILGLLKERVSLFPEPVLAAARRNLEWYKRYRHLLQNDCYHLLPAGSGEGQYQATQFLSPSAKESVVLAFKADSSQESVQLRLRGLQASGTYEVTFANGGRTLQIVGGELLSNGITVLLAHPATSEVVLLRMLA